MSLIHNDQIKNGRLIRQYRWIEYLGKGSFGIVCKFEYVQSKDIYAIKIIELPVDEVNEDTLKKLSREISILKKIDHDNIVEYYGSWFENNETHVVFHIQMEFCWFTLDYAIIRYMRNYFNRKANTLWPLLGYYMATQLMHELVNGIGYLHSNKPPIIHRDIKPTNVLICYHGSGKFIKIAGFGLAIEHSELSMSHTKDVGAVKYMAPEVMNSGRYGPEADMFSIGVVLHKLFNFELISAKTLIFDDSIRVHYHKIIEITKKLIDSVAANRLSCQEILQDTHGLELPAKLLKDHIAKTFSKKCKGFENNQCSLQSGFVQYYFHVKFHPDKLIKTNFPEDALDNKSTHRHNNRITSSRNYQGATQLRTRKLSKANHSRWPNWITDKWNNYLGSNITYIVNAYHKYERVSVCYDRIDPTNDANLTSMNFEPLLYSDIVHKRRNNTYDYLTVFAQRPDGQIERICNNHKIPANRSYIVTAAGTVKESVYDMLWTDHQGYDHYQDVIKYSKWSKPLATNHES